MAWAREMSLTGNFVDAQTALRIGLANHVVSHEALLEFALERARAITDQNPQMVKTMREDWDATDRLPLPEARRLHADYARKAGFASSTGAGIAAHRTEVIARARAQR
jgi:enoyl-CoA hydratase